MASKLSELAKAKKVRYFLINFTDLKGVQRSKLVPASAIADMEKNGAGFAGFATHLDMTPADPDMFALPDPESATILPWNPEVAWVASDLYMAGKPVEQAPRWVLKRQLEKAAKAGYVVKTGVEPEFHLIDPEGTGLSDPKDMDPKPCYDQTILMRRYAVISEICDGMQALGWGPYQNDHEDANGQFEMNWHYSEALTTADRHHFFKYMVRSIAEKHGFRATFMPKPFAHLTGNGCHVHLSIWDKTGKKNLFDDAKDELGISDLGYSFLGGVLKHAEQLCALTNPTVNSYKRLNAPVTASGATWSPNTITWSGNNRTHLVRVPEGGRFEFRLADGAANSYLAQAGYIAAGLAGIAGKLSPGKRQDIDMYADGHKVKAKKLPLYMLDALRAFEGSKFLKQELGAEFHAAYVKIRGQEWDDYSRHLTDWERQSTLDC